VEKRAKASESVTGEVSSPDHGEALRIAEALLFASAAPLSADDLRGRLPEGADVEAILRDITELYSSRGVHLVKVSGRYAFRTAGDLAYVMARDVVEPRRLSRAAMETLAIVAYHQPVTGRKSRRSVASRPRRAPSTPCSKRDGCAFAGGARPPAVQ
jgi:segregation and condensation protein B